ncbi:MAG: Crp/Fnr family transcriptional regulator [Clostridia bacterium]
MNKYLPVIANSILFDGIKNDELAGMLVCLNAVTKTFDKGEYVFRYGEDINRVGLVISGKIHIVRLDFWGNETIISQITSGGLFGESYASSQDMTIYADVVVIENSEIMFLDINRILTTCSAACVYHTKLIRNLVSVLANKNILLKGKIDNISQRTTKSKILTYLSSQSQKAKSNSFEIPFNRQQLANYLSVDRSAMSNELCKLRDEGILKFEKEHFELL